MQKEKKVIRLFGIYDKPSRKIPRSKAGSVYCTYGLSPTLDCCGGGYQMPLIVIKGKRMKVDDRYMLSKKMKKYINSYDSKYQVRKGNLVINRTIAVSKTTREGVSRADTSDFICRELEENTNIDGMNLEDFNIRKLTEKEFFRLMGFCPIDESGNFDDTNYYKASAVVSSTQLYKQMGNSIVVDCLASIFKELM